MSWMNPFPIEALGEERLATVSKERDMWRETSAELTRALNAATNERDCLRAELAALKAEIRRLGGAT